MTNVSDTLELAAVQLSSQSDLGRNLEIARARCFEAARRGARMIVLPENLAYMGPEEGRRAGAESLEALDGPIARTLSTTASDTGAFVVAGGVPERSDDPLRPHNTCAVFAPDGSLHARYRKIHLFDVDLADGTRLHESSASTAGGEPVVAVVDGFTVGLSICYDLRFPELYARLVEMGAQVIVAPAAFTLATGKDHWQVLVRARAIETQTYVVAAAQWGKHPGGRTTFGKSMIVDPWGAVLAQCSEGEGVCTATARRDYLESVRASVPVRTHRRLRG